MPFTQTTLAQLRARMADRWKGTPFWSEDDDKRGINVALRFWNLLTGQWRQQYPTPTVANQYFYTVPSSLTFGARVTWNDRPLQPGSITGLNLGMPNWRRETTTTGGVVPDRPTVFAPAGLRSFVIWPADAASNNALIVDGVRATPILSADGDFIDLGPEEEQPILEEAIHVMAFKIGGGLWRSTFTLHRRFLLAAADRNARLKADTMLRRIMGLDYGRKSQPLRLPILDEAVQMFTATFGAEARG